MSWIYDLSDGRKACLYTERNRIMFHAFPSRNGGMPAVAKDDHESGLTAAMYYGTIYFSYISTGGELIFDGIGSGEEISLGSAEGIKAGPDLAAAAGNLLLFCLRRGEDGNMMRLEAVDPYRAGRPWIVAEGKGLSGYRVIRQQNSVLVLVFCGNEIEEEKVWKDGRFCQTTQIRYRQEMSRLEKEYSVLKRRMQEQEREQRNLLEMERHRNSELENTLEKYREEIRYAKQKYDELAGFAGRLQAAVKQWREKYMEEIPGQ